jgi:hypothetical protein
MAMFNSFLYVYQAGYIVDTLWIPQIISTCIHHHPGDCPMGVIGVTFDATDAGVGRAELGLAPGVTPRAFKRSCVKGCFHHPFLDV